jgi:hypothetical protein
MKNKCAGLHAVATTGNAGNTTVYSIESGDSRANRNLKHTQPGPSPFSVRLQSRLPQALQGNASYAAIRDARDTSIRERPSDPSLH